jgi:hypothetical protein
MTPTAPTWLPVCTPTAWWHVALSDEQTLSDIGPHEESDDAAVLADWLLEAAGRHRLEFRLVTGGPQAGVWLGLSSVGATPSDADAARQAATAELGAALSAFRWQARRADGAPTLPRCLAGLHTGPRAAFVNHFSRTRRALGRLAPEHAPVVLRVQLDPTACAGHLVRDATALRLQARVQAHRQIARGTTGSARNAHVETIRRIEQLRDDATRVRVQIALHGDQHPGTLPLRLVASDISEDLASVATWGPAPAPSFEGGFEVVVELLELASLHDSVIRSRRGGVDLSTDELPPIL